MLMPKIKVFFLLTFFIFQIAKAQRHMEYLDRGLVAVVTDDEGVFLSWRLLGTDPENLAFNLYRTDEGQKDRKLNKKPLTERTNFLDMEGDEEDLYFVKPVIDGREREASKVAEVWKQNYLSIPLQAPEGYSANDSSVGDLDGDGDYELVVHMTGRGRDNSHEGFTDEPVFQAYTMEGELLWTINLGKNIREGAHYSQFIVIDLDGDGKAEFATKTADGTVDGKGKVIGDTTKDWRNDEGMILQGPEYFTVFNGEAGEALATADYIPGRGDLCGWGGVGGNGGNDCSGNRADRFLAGAALLDGELPSVLMARGYYGRSVIAAWDYRDGQLTSRWVFDSENRKNPFSGQGNHGLSINDVDKDGKDEIVYGAMVVDDDGTGLFSTGLRHGDALHVSRFDPSIPDQLAWGIHENETNKRGYGVALYNARSGEILWGAEEGKDVGRGLAMDIDPRKSRSRNVVEWKKRSI